MRNMKPILCKACGAEIDLIWTRAGKSIPVDWEPVMVLEAESPRGDEDWERFITEGGDFITGRKARPEEESQWLPVAFVPHWVTCPATANFRRRR